MICIPPCIVLVWDVVYVLVPASQIFEAHHFLYVAKKESENAIGREIRKHAGHEPRYIGTFCGCCGTSSIHAAISESRPATFVASKNAVLCFGCRAGARDCLGGRTHARKRQAGFRPCGWRDDNTKYHCLAGGEMGPFTLFHFYRPGFVVSLFRRFTVSPFRITNITTYTHHRCRTCKQTPNRRSASRPRKVNCPFAYAQ